MVLIFLILLSLFCCLDSFVRDGMLGGRRGFAAGGCILGVGFWADFAAEPSGLKPRSAYGLCRVWFDTLDLGIFAFHFRNGVV
jgi:hypothetical protein